MPNSRLPSRQPVASSTCFVDFETISSPAFPLDEAGQQVQRAQRKIGIASNRKSTLVDKPGSERTQSVSSSSYGS